MKTLVLILFLSKPVFGQIIDSHSPNKTGMYFYSIDSLMNILIEYNKIDRIHLRSEESILSKFPDEQKGISILKMNNQKNIKSNKLKEGELLIDVGDVQVINDRLSIRLRVFERLNKGLTFHGDGLYIFIYSYMPESKEYGLIELESGIEL